MLSSGLSSLLAKIEHRSRPLDPIEPTAPIAGFHCLVHWVIAHARDGAMLALFLELMTPEVASRCRRVQEVAWCSRRRPAEHCNRFCNCDVDAHGQAVVVHSIAPGIQLRVHTLPFFFVNGGRPVGSGGRSQRLLWQFGHFTGRPSILVAHSKPQCLQSTLVPTESVFFFIRMNSTPLDFGLQAVLQQFHAATYRRRSRGRLRTGAPSLPHRSAARTPARPCT